MLRINLCAFPDVGLCGGKISILTSLSGSKPRSFQTPGTVQYVRLEVRRQICIGRTKIWKLF